jgi:hypothetical protein
MIKTITAGAALFVLFIWICWALGMIADTMTGVDDDDW